MKALWFGRPPREVENEIGSRHENATRLSGRSPGTGDGDGAGLKLCTGLGLLLTAACPLWVQATISTTTATNQRLMEVQREIDDKGDALCRAPLPLQLLVPRRRIASRRACDASGRAGDAGARDHRPRRRLWSRQVSASLPQGRGQASDRCGPRGRWSRGAPDRAQPQWLL